MVSNPKNCIKNQKNVQLFLKNNVSSNDNRQDKSGKIIINNSHLKLSSRTMSPRAFLYYWLSRLKDAGLLHYFQIAIDRIGHQVFLVQHGVLPDDNRTGVCSPVVDHLDQVFSGCSRRAPESAPPESPGS